MDGLYRIRKRGKRESIRGARLLPCVVAVLLAGCGGGREDLARLLPALPPEQAGMLARPDGARFASFAEEAASDRFAEMHLVLVDALHGSPEPAAADARRLRDALAAVDGVLTARGLPAYARESALLDSLPPAGAAGLVADYHRLSDVLTAPDLAVDARLTALEELQARLLAAGHVRGALLGWDCLAAVRHRHGEWDEARRLNRQAYELGTRAGFLQERCHNWGQMLMYHMRRGWTAAERDTTRELIRRAEDARLALAASLLVSLDAYDAVNQGRYSTARTLFEDAINLCGALGDRVKALAAYDLLLRMYASLECWRQVDEHLPLAEQLRVEYQERPGITAGRHLGQVRHASLGARSLAAQGRADAAHAAFAEVLALSMDQPFSEVGYLGQQWVEAMMANDRPDLVGEALETVEDAARSTGSRHALVRLPLWRAWLDWREGRPDSALARLDSFAATALVEPVRVEDHLRFRHDALRARLTAPRDPAAAARILAQGWGGLLARLQQGEAGPESYLDLGRNSQLRWAAQDVLGADPEVGYGLEMLWRRTFLRRRPAPADPAGYDLVAAARDLAADARARLAARDAVHCLYEVDRRRVVRFTADRAGVVRDTLAVPADSLRTLVRALLHDLGTDPGDAAAALPPALAADLGRVARLVLPDRCLDPARRPSRLYVTGESFLAQIPFSPLNLAAAGGYEPLVAAMDVAWVRGCGGDDEAPTRTGEALIVADPLLDAGTRRRFHLPPGLPGVATELGAVRASLQPARVLHGDQATLPAVLAAWRRADVLYFLGHAVRDAEVPFSTWLPLAAADTADVYPGLDIKDVLDTPCGGCRLVVLSGCATGAPYVDGLSTTPSLGDAFLDGGAAAVLQTFWRVRDEGSAFAPERVLAGWRAGGQDLAAAVAAERRRSLQSPAGVRHPFDWAAWTLKSSWF